MAKQKKTTSMMLNELSFITSDLILKNVPFVIFLGFLATIYIANAHYAERNIRKIQVIQKDLKELRWYYMSLQAENMYNSKRSEVVEKVTEEGLRPMRNKPKRITLSEKN